MKTVMAKTVIQHCSGGGFIGWCNPPPQPSGGGNPPFLRAGYMGGLILSSQGGHYSIHADVLRIYVFAIFRMLNKCVLFISLSDVYIGVQSVCLKIR